MPLLYDAVAVGMTAATRLPFRVTTFRPRRFELRPGTTIVATHRAETDVPLLCPSLYWGARLWADRGRRVSFAARADLFEPGFLAGFPPALPPVLRRALWGVDFGPFLRNLGCVPVESATSLRLRDLFTARPDLRLDEGPPGVAEELRTRARDAGLPLPGRGGDVLRGEYGDLLWRSYPRADLARLVPEELWSRRAALAARDFRELVELVRRGGVLVVFPEGRPSPDGAIGPLLPGLDALLRRGRPARLLPLGIAYDPLVRGRARAYIALAPEVPPPPEDVEEELLRLLRRAVPLTCGQVVATELLAGESSFARLERRLTDAVAEATAAGRLFEAALADERARRDRLAEALAAAAAREHHLPRLALEFASSREL